MTGFRGWTESEEIVDPLTPETLRPLLQSAASYVVVDNPGWGEQFRARASRTGDERWQVEITDPALGARHTTDVNADAAFDILRSWAAADGWWAEAFTWQLTRR